MLFTIASFTMSTVGTLIAVIGFITQSGQKHSRLARLGWVFLVVVGASYLLGMYSLLSPRLGLPGILPANSAMPAVLALLVGAVGTLSCSYLAALHRWRRWALAGVVIIPLVTIIGVGYRPFF